MSAAQQWATELAGWRIDEEILGSVPDSPYALPPELFRAPADAGGSVLHTRAREALPRGGTVLDVGCGAGVASLPLLDTASALTGVDTSPGMLAELARAAAERAPGITLRTVEGSWPTQGAPVHDVVVCRNVAYNVADLTAFALALTSHARHRVVLALHARHPWVEIGPLWLAVHGQPRPPGPTADLAEQVLRDAGLRPGRTQEPSPPLAPVSPAAEVAFLRRRLCLPLDREPEVVALLAARDPRPPQQLVTFWWPGTAGAGGAA